MTKILIIEANFYPEISQMLKNGCEEYLRGYKEISFEHITVPGCFEIPAAISITNTSGKYAGFVALGSVIRGETTHYDYVCQESARGINDLAIREKLAIGFGIITAENYEQASVRAATNKKNVGARAALACMSLIKLKKQYGQ